MSVLLDPMKAAAVVLSLALAGAGVGTAMEVEVRRGPRADFSAYETYAWMPRPEVGADHPLAEGSDLDRRIREAADRVLREYGLRRVEPESPDLWVDYTGIVEDELVIEGTRREIVSGVDWIGDPHAHWMRAYQKGTLVIEIFETDRRSMVWTGWATGVADTPERLRRKAVTAARRILRHLPPRR